MPKPASLEEAEVAARGGRIAVVVPRVEQMALALMLGASNSSISAGRSAKPYVRAR